MPVANLPQTHAQEEILGKGFVADHTIANLLGPLSLVTLRVPFEWEISLFVHWYSGQTWN